jgi:predicted nucleic acid binding AN1-type Zn finger protein
MPCDLCKKKGIPLDCNYCRGHYCSRCINLEQHKCEGIADKKKESINNLKNQLKYKVSTTLPLF